LIHISQTGNLLTGSKPCKACATLTVRDRLGLIAQIGVLLSWLGYPNRHQCIFRCIRNGSKAGSIGEYTSIASGMCWQTLVSRRRLTLAQTQISVGWTFQGGFGWREQTQ
jgi:hypothetical protein